MLQGLGPPEEIVCIEIKADDEIISIHRIVYPTEVLFIPGIPDIVIAHMLQSENCLWLSAEN